METVSNVALILAMARDALLFVLLLALLLGALLITRKVAGLLNEAQKVVADTRKMVETLTENVVQPAASNSGLAYGAGKVGAFILGLKRNKRKKGDNDNGK